MNPKVSFYTPPLPKFESYRETIDAAAEYGLQAVEGLNIYEFATPDLEVAREMRAYADSKNVRFSCFSVFCNLVGDNADQAVDMVKAYADVAATLGSPFLHHTIVSETQAPEKILPFTKEYFEQGVQAVREIFDYAKERGVKSVFEDQGYLFNGVENFGRFLKEVDRDVGVVADFGNIAQAGEDIIGFLQAYAPRVCHVHIKDIVVKDENTGNGLRTLDKRYMHEVPLGKGEVPMEEAVNLLRAVGYDGFYSLESRGRTDEPSEIVEMLCFATDLLGE